MSKHKNKKPKPNEDEWIYCPICRKDDLLAEDTDIPQMSVCHRCSVQFFLEDLEETEDTEVDVAAPVQQPLEYKGYSGVSSDPVFGAVVELTETSRV